MNITGKVSNLGLMTPLILVNIGSGNGLLLDNAKTIPESVLIHHKWGFVALTKFTWIAQDLKKMSLKKKIFEITSTSPKVQWIKLLV